MKHATRSGKIVLATFLIVILVVFGSTAAFAKDIKPGGQPDGGIWADSQPEGGIWADSQPEGGMWADGAENG